MVRAKLILSLSLSARLSLDGNGGAGGGVGGTGEVTVEGWSRVEDRGRIEGRSVIKGWHVTGGWGGSEHRDLNGGEADSGIGGWLSARCLEGPFSSCGLRGAELRSREGRSGMYSSDDLWEVQYSMSKWVTSTHLMWAGDFTLCIGCEHRGFNRYRGTHLGADHTGTGESLRSDYSDTVICDPRGNYSPREQRRTGATSERNLA